MKLKSRVWLVLAILAITFAVVRCGAGLVLSTAAIGGISTGSSIAVVGAT